MNDQIKFETANLAEKKGFLFEYIGNVLVNIPTQSELQKWLRENHNSIVEVLYDTSEYPEQLKFFSTVNYFGKNLDAILTDDDDFHSDSYIIYENAFEIGLFEALKLLPDFIS